MTSRKMEERFHVRLNGDLDDSRGHFSLVILQRESNRDVLRKKKLTGHSLTLRSW